MSTDHERGDLAALFASMTPEEQTAILADLPPEVVEVILESLPPAPEPVTTAPHDGLLALLRTLHPDDLAWAVADPEEHR